MNADRQTGPTRSPDGPESQDTNPAPYSDTGDDSDDDRNGSWAREYLIAQVVIVIAIAGLVVGVVLSEDRGLASLSTQPERTSASSGGFSIIQPGSAPPIVCPGATASEYPMAKGGLADDCAALLSAKDILAGSGSLDWSVDVPITQWPGVIATQSNDEDPARVVALNLTTSGLSGEIPPALGDLSALQALHLYGNELTGPIPPELGRLANLTILDLGGNTLTGEIPPEIGDMTSLTWMDLSFNDLSGPVPAEISTLVSLEWLVISGNDLSGTITDKLHDLTNLTYLSLHDTSLEGCLPDTFQDIDGFLGDLPFCNDQ